MGWQPQADCSVGLAEDEQGRTGRVSMKNALLKTPILRCHKVIRNHENFTRSITLMGEFPLTCERTVIGRYPREISHLSCWDGGGTANEDFSVRLNDVLYIVPSTVLLSRNHAAITRQGEHDDITYWIEDLNSGSGVYLNDSCIGLRGKFPLAVGDKIRMGNLRLELHI